MYKHAIFTLLCLMGKTDTFGLYDDSTDIKIIDTGPDSRKSEKDEKRLKFLSEKVENYCFGSAPCSRKTFQAIIPDRKIARGMWLEYINCSEARPTSKQHIQLCFLQKSCKTKMKRCLQRKR